MTERQAQLEDDVWQGCNMTPNVQGLAASTGIWNTEFQPLFKCLVKYRC
jgi:hypothetical protein